MRKRRLLWILLLSLLIIICFSVSAFAQGYGAPGPRPPMQPPPPGGMNQALDMCYANCTKDLQMCLRPTLAPGSNKQTSANIVNSCTDRVKPCMMNCIR
jgi:hypothetical protein